MISLRASDLTLDQVHQLLKLEERDGLSFSSLLSLKPLTEVEQHDLNLIRANFKRYLSAGKVLEGVVRFLVIAPLLQLSGFYAPPVNLRVEEGIAPINIDGETNITGRFDLVATQNLEDGTEFWLLVIETKEGFAAPQIGLPQVLSYAYTSLERQSSVFGVTTNGESYRFVYLQAGDPPTYCLLPELNLTDLDRAIQLLQVLKAIVKSAFTVSEAAAGEFPSVP
jgi:hypothetical protein